jgi:hypothetical protein
MGPMTEREADDALADAEELVPLMKGTMAYLKEIRARCLEAGVPAAMGCPDGKSCGPTTHLLVREEDLPRVAEVLHGEWQAMLANEGEGAVVHAKVVGDDEEPPCPACGTQAPLVEGACSDCGLTLE